MSESTVTADIAHNRLRMRLTGRMEWKQARAFAELLRLEACKLRHGFGVIADATGLEEIAPDGAESELRWIHMHLLQGGAQRLVHILGHSDGSDRFASTAPARSTQVTTANSVFEAECLLDTPEAADPVVTVSYRH